MKNRNLIILAVVILAVGGGIYFLNGTKPVAEQVLAHFVDKNNTFTFDYNPAFSVATPDPNMNDSTDITLAELDVPKSFLPAKTNFSDAKLYVLISTDAETIKNCGAKNSSGALTDKTIVSGFPFSRVRSNDAGAGNFYDTTSYQGLVDGDCYTIMYTIHSTNIGNYPPEAGIKEFDKVKIVDEMEQIVKSFKFLVKSD